MSLPVAKVLLGAVMIPWWNRGRFLAALLVPGALIVALHLAWVSYPGEMPRWLSWAAWAVNALLYVIFAVVCHRLILLEDAPGLRMVSWSMRETRFAGFAALVWIAYAVTGFGAVLLVGTPVLDVTASLISADNAKWVAQACMWAAGIIGTYFMARVALVLPAAAIDQKLNPAESWKATRGNGWRLALVVGVLPWVLSALLDLAYRSEASAVASVGLAILGVVTLAVEIAALSLSYQQLVPPAKQSGPVELASGDAA